MTAARLVFGLPLYRIIGFASFLVFFTINLIALSTPVADVGWTAGLLSDLNLTVILRSLVLATLLGVLTPFTVYLLRQRAKAHLGASSMGIVCSGFLCLLGPLCCGAVSIVLGGLAGLLPATAAYESHVYAFLGHYEGFFFYLSIVLLGYALYMNSRHIAAMTDSST